VDYGLDLHEASILMGMCGDYQIGSIVGRRTVVHKLPKKMLRAYRTPCSGALHPAAHAVGARRPVTGHSIQQGQELGDIQTKKGNDHEPLSDET
jgi:hypothetical protein